MLMSHSLTTMMQGLGLGKGKAQESSSIILPARWNTGLRGESLGREAEEIARGGQAVLESQLSQPWIFRRNHGFPMGWANERGGKRNGNDQQTAQGQSIQSQDVNILAISSLLLPTPGVTRMPIGRRLEEISSASSLQFTQFASLAACTAEVFTLHSMQNLIQENGGMWVSFFFSLKHNVHILQPTHDIRFSKIKCSRYE